MNVAFGSIAGDQYAPFGSRLRDIAETLVRTRMEQCIEPLIAIAVRTALYLPRGRDRFADIEDNRDVGGKPEQSRQSGNRVAIRTLAITLIRHRGIEKPVAHH